MATMTMDRLNGILVARDIDRSAKYQHSERGFNSAMRVASDRPSRVELWTAGMRVSPQRVHTDGLSYSQRTEAAKPLPQRKYYPETVYRVGASRISTFGCKIGVSGERVKRSRARSIAELFA